MTEAAQSHRGCTLQPPPWKNGKRTKGFQNAGVSAGAEQESNGRAFLITFPSPGVSTASTDMKSDQRHWQWFYKSSCPSSCLWPGRIMFRFCRCISQGRERLKRLSRSRSNKTLEVQEQQPQPRGHRGGETMLAPQPGPSSQSQASYDLI